jgi:hypothetical protein
MTLSPVLVRLWMTAPEYLRPVSGMRLHREYTFWRDAQAG